MFKDTLLKYDVDLVGLPTHGLASLRNASDLLQGDVDLLLKLLTHEPPILKFVPMTRADSLARIEQRKERERKGELLLTDNYVPRKGSKVSHSSSL